MLSIVLEVTDDKRLEKAERKRLQIVHAASLSHEARLVKIADKICNVLDLANRPPVGWPAARREEYLPWTEQVVHGRRGVHDQLEAHYDLVLEAARSGLVEVPGAACGRGPAELRAEPEAADRIRRRPGEERELTS